MSRNGRFGGIMASGASFLVENKALALAASLNGFIGGSNKDQASANAIIKRIPKNPFASYDSCMVNGVKV
jgi:hypothetical protein